MLEQLRREETKMPVILLSARHELESKVYGLGLGADDYVTKPFSPAELVARVQAHLRRASGALCGNAAARHGPNRDTRIRQATIIMQKADYMNDLLRKLFRLAQLDDPSKAFQKREGYLDSLLQTIMADYVLVLQDKGVAWRLELPETPGAATFDGDGLTQAIRNLIDNAILHGGDGKYLGIRLKRTGDTARIEIEDRGKGIPPHEMERIFEPFYRIDRGRPSDGLGVGLTLANAIVRQHGGVIESRPSLSSATSSA